MPERGLASDRTRPGDRLVAEPIIIIGEHAVMLEGARAEHWWRTHTLGRVDGKNATVSGFLGEGLTEKLCD